MQERSEQRGALSRYLSELGQIRPLSREEERDVLRDLANGRRAQAIDRLVESNLGFVVRVAREYRNLGLSFEDLLCEGNLGLIEAARRFEPTRGVRFLTYAVWWVRKAILRALAEKVQLVRVPHNQQKKVRDVRDARQRLERSLGRPPSAEEISSQVGLRPQVVERLQQIGRGQTSLDGTAGRPGQTPLAELLCDLGLDSEQRLLRKESLAVLDEALGRLSEQQRVAIGLRFGLDGESPMTLRQAGARLGLSRERVRQIEQQAKRQLRDAFASESTLER